MFDPNASIWYLSDGQYYWGPYSWVTVIQMPLCPQVSLIWAYGMNNWEPIDLVVQRVSANLYQQPPGVSPQKPPIAKLRFGRSMPPPKCSLDGCDGAEGFWYCQSCDGYYCGKHFSRKFLGVFLSKEKCPKCGSVDIEKV